MNLPLNKIALSDCIDYLKSLPDNCVNTCITSPPYFGLRDYGVEGQIGLEKSVEEYVEKIVLVFSEVKRVLRDDGTLWLNLGDSYATKSPNGGQGKNKQVKKSVFSELPKKNKMFDGIKPKDLIGVPWRVAFALQADGWYLRQDIIWHKPNPMPESVTDRCTKAHEYIFLLSKSQKYYYDQEAIKTPLKDESIRRLVQDVENQKGSNRVPNKSNGNMKAVYKKRKEYDKSMSGGGTGIVKHSGYYGENGELLVKSMVNKKSVWTVTTKPFSEAHFATFPEDLIEPCVLAGCPIDGVVLDPFMGAGTTALVSLRAQRNFLGSELNPEYLKIANKRIDPYLNQVEIFKKAV